MTDDDEMADQPDFLGTTDFTSGIPLMCVYCGRPLGESGDDQPDWPGGPMCGDCYQARQMDDEIWWSEQDEGA